MRYRTKDYRFPLWLGVVLFLIGIIGTISAAIEEKISTAWRHLKGDDE